MTATQRLINSVFLAVFVLFSTVPAVLANVAETSYLPRNLSSWVHFGSPTVSGDKVTIQGSQREWVSVDISAKDLNSSHILIASYVDKSDSRKTYSSGDRERSGNPYLYAYFLDSNGKIIQYLTGSQTTSTTRSDSDHVVYGIFPTVSGTKSMRVFLKQSSVKNISNSGVDVSFMKPVLIKATSVKNATDIVNAYAAQTVDVSYSNTATLTSSRNSGTTSMSTASSCAGTSGTNIMKIGFESGEWRDTSLKFGSSLAAWYYGVHDYSSNVSPYDKATTSQVYAGSYSLGLTNGSYGYVNGEAAIGPQLYDEALRWVATGKLEKNAKYAFSIRAKYVQGSSSQSSVGFYLSQETGSDGSGSIVNSKLVNASDSWKCLEYEFTNRESTSTVQDLVVFFGSLPKGSTLYIDEIQLIKK